MDATGRTLVILLSMHRSGSSLTASVLQRLGMSLGPFELMGASPSNPHGHFESLPICELNRKVQGLFHGFIDDMPTTEDNLEAFLRTQGSWDPTETIPEEFVSEGRGIVASLLESGTVSGFKDPRTILTWPFWRRVLVAFPDVRVVPVALVRSPHPIAMSLWTRSEGAYGYWSCLDLIAVHLRRLQAIIQEWDAPLPIVRFGNGQYLNDLAEAARSCGLAWDPTAARGNMDEACIHHAPATVAHESQAIYQALAGLSVDPVESPTNRASLAADERVRETLAGRRMAQLLARLEEAEHQLHQTRVELEEVSVEASRAREQLGCTQDRLRETQEQMVRSHAEARDLLIRSRAEAHELHTRLEHFERHFVLGPALRGRRRLKTVFGMLRDRAAL
jgi:hypothetical protein